MELPGAGATASADGLAGLYAAAVTGFEGREQLLTPDTVTDAVRTGDGQVPFEFLHQAAAVGGYFLKDRVGSVPDMTHTPLVRDVPHEQLQIHIHPVGGEPRALRHLVGGEHVVDEPRKLYRAEPSHLPAKVPQGPIRRRTRYLVTQR